MSVRQNLDDLDDLDKTSLSQLREKAAKAEKYRRALEEIRITVKSTHHDTAIERRMIAEKALGYMP